MSLPTRENPGWHLYLMMSPEDTKSRHQYEVLSLFSCIFLLIHKGCRGEVRPSRNKPFTACLSQDPHLQQEQFRVSNQSHVHVFGAVGGNYFKHWLKALETYLTAGAIWEMLFDFTYESETFPPFHTHLSPARHPPSACQRWALLEEAGKPLIGRLGEETRQHESREGRERKII